MDKNRNLYNKGKPFIEIYEFLPVAGMPICVSNGSNDIFTINDF
jgi:hypothetical protein